MLKYFTKKAELSNINNFKEKFVLNPTVISIQKAFGAEVTEFITKFTAISHSSSLVLFTNNTFNLHALTNKNTNAIINLEKVNDILQLNNFFETINEKLPEGGIFIGCVETKGSRKIRILAKYPPAINYIVYYCDFIFKRVFPRLPITRKIYFKTTAGRNRVLSRTETLGRLYACGFKVCEEQIINNKLYFAAVKAGTPTYEPEPTYGPIYKMKRVGKEGKIIEVYKFRTMHAFAEHLQQYVYEKYNLKEGGKFSNDFRVSTLGKLFRKYWIDELPMIINLIKGDLKLVGVRPLSKHYMSLYTDDLKQKRIRVKPGLIPPFYADMPKTIAEIMESENRYLDSYMKAPFKTDLTYFFKALNNILFKKARSS
ncbi:MAG: sugar transferase [Bacteroidia bacterium]|nr:sugar transferase [Bacteroidia bacterium]